MRRALWQPSQALEENSDGQAGESRRAEKLLRLASVAGQALLLYLLPNSPRRDWRGWAAVAGKAWRRAGQAVAWASLPEKKTGEKKERDGLLVGMHGPIVKEGKPYPSLLTEKW